MLVSVEKMLRIEHDLLTFVFKVLHGVGNHVKVFAEPHAYDFRRVKIPALAEYRHRRRVRLEKRPQPLVVLRSNALSARRAERRQPRFSEVLADYLAKKLRVLGVRSRVACLDKINAELREGAANRYLVANGKRDALALRSVPKRGIEYQYFFFHLAP